MHEMEIVQASDNWETWTCPECGRILFVTWIPKFKRLVVVKGDDVPHTGGNLKIETPKIGS